MAKKTATKKTATKKVTAKKPVKAAVKPAKASAKVVVKKVKPVTSVKPASAKAAPMKAPVKPMPPTKAAKPVVKPAKPVSVEVPEAVKPSVMSKSSEQGRGEMLIEKAKEEMAGINSAKITAEKNAKIKPIKIERGNAADEKAKWQELFKRYGKEKAVAYKMTDSFDALKPLQHKVLGWGFVLSNENNRLEVLFENGIKMLISNYKAF